MNEKSELYLSDGRSFVVPQTAVKLTEQLIEKKENQLTFTSIVTADGKSVYINPQFVISVTDYSYPEEDFSYLDGN